MAKTTKKTARSGSRAKLRLDGGLPKCECGCGEIAKSRFPSGGTTPGSTWRSWRLKMRAKSATTPAAVPLGGQGSLIDTPRLRLRSGSFASPSAELFYAMAPPKLQSAEENSPDANSNNSGRYALP